MESVSSLNLSHGGQRSVLAAHYGFAPDSLIDFSANLNVWAPEVSDGVWQNFKSSVREYPSLDEEIISSELSKIYHLDKKYILPLSGAIEGIYLMLLFNREKKLVTLEPTFTEYSRIANSLGIDHSPIVVPLSEYSDMSEKLLAELQGNELVFLCNPNNPTASLLSKNTLKALISSAPSTVTWILDEAFIEFSGDLENSTLQDLEDISNLLIIRSLTKIWNVPGLRLGFLASSNQSLLNDLKGVQIPWSINAIAQSWFREFVTAESYSKLIRGLEELPKARAKLAAGLASTGLFQVHPSNANFLLLELKDRSLDSSMVFERMLREGFIVRETCDFIGLESGRFIRVAVKKSDENDLLLESIRKEFL